MRWASGTILVVVLALVVAIGDSVGAVACAGEHARAALAGAAARTGADNTCNANTDKLTPHVAARHLMAGRYKLGHHPLVRLGLWPSWAEDPLHDRNWRERLHMLRFLMALMIEWRDTGASRYRDRAFALLRSWIAHNPRSHPASAYSWGDHSTAWRTMTMVCMARMLPRQAWLSRAIATHGAVLADPGFYVGRGNHALNQAIALLDAGCYLRRTGWQRLASQRIDGLSFVIEADGRRERVRATASGASISDAP